MLDEAGLIAAEHARRAAIERDDLDAIEAMTADVFHYAHISGLIEDRDEYFTRIHKRHVSMRTSARDLKVRMRKGYALLDGVSRLDVAQAGDTRMVIETFFLSVWEPTEDGWKISAYASTPLSA